MTPFYHALPNVGGFGVELTAEEIGIGVVATVAGLTAVHAVGTVIRIKRRKNARASWRAPVKKPPKERTLPPPTKPPGNGRTKLEAEE